MSDYEPCDSIKEDNTPKNIFTVHEGRVFKCHQTPSGFNLHNLFRLKKKSALKICLNKPVQDGLY